MALIKCNHCGRLMSNAAQTCLGCGMPLHDTPMDERTVVAPNAPSNEVRNLPHDLGQNPYQPAHYQPVAPRQNNTWIIVILVVLVVLLVFFGLYMWHDRAMAKQIAEEKSLRDSIVLAEKQRLEAEAIAQKQAQAEAELAAQRQRESDMLNFANTLGNKLTDGSLESDKWLMSHCSEFMANNLRNRQIQCAQEDEWRYPDGIDGACEIFLYDDIDVTGDTFLEFKKAESVGNQCFRLKFKWYYIEGSDSGDFSIKVRFVDGESSFLISEVVREYK